MLMYDSYLSIHTSIYLCIYIHIYQHCYNVSVCGKMCQRVSIENCQNMSNGVEKRRNIYSQTRALIWMSRRQHKRLGPLPVCRLQLRWKPSIEKVLGPCKCLDSWWVGVWPRAWNVLQKTKQTASLKSERQVKTELIHKLQLILMLAFRGLIRCGSRSV